MGNFGIIIRFFILGFVVVIVGYGNIWNRLYVFFLILWIFFFYGISNEYI